MIDESNSTTIPKVLVVATNDSDDNFLKHLGLECEFLFLKKKNQFEEQYENYEDGHIAFIICGEESGLDFSFEVAQIMRNQCPSTPSYFISHNKNNFIEKKMIKNGFSKAFLLPIDLELFKENAVQNFSSENLKKRFYKTIKIFDLLEDTELGFDTYVYLPLNNKYVHFTSKDQKLTSKKLEKLKSQNMGSLLIDQKDLPLFYEYAANHLKELASGTGPLSETERQEKLKEAIRGLFVEIFDQSAKSDYDSGKEMLQTCQKIISTYITGNSQANWYNQMINLLGGTMGGYDHAANVSTLAALFAIALNHPHPEDLALAGFLHDISLSDFSIDLYDQPQEKWPEKYRKMYLDHPQQSINLIRQKKMIITEEVEKAILQHHEMWNGKGFPKQLNGERITEEAQILSLANQFNDLTVQETGKKNFTPIEAIDKISQNGSIGLALVRNIRKLFENESKK